MLTAPEANPDGEHTLHSTQRQKGACGIPARTCTPARASHSAGQAAGNARCQRGLLPAPAAGRRPCLRGQAAAAHGQRKRSGPLSAEAAPRLHRRTERSPPPGPGPGPPAPRSPAGTRTALAVPNEESDGKLGKASPAAGWDAIPLEPALHHHRDTCHRRALRGCGDPPPPPVTAQSARGIHRYPRPLAQASGCPASLLPPAAPSPHRAGLARREERLLRAVAEGEGRPRGRRARGAGRGAADVPERRRCCPRRRDCSRLGRGPPRAHGGGGGTGGARAHRPWQRRPEPRARVEGERAHPL